MTDGFVIIHRKLPGYFALALLAFIASYLLLPTSKMVNNVYYALLAVPALGVLVWYRQRGLRRDPLLWLWGALFAWFAVIGALSGDGQFYKHLLYIALFVLAVSQWVDPRAFRADGFARGLFWILGFYVLGSALVYWATGRYAVGERVIWLPSRMTGPIYTSMWLVCCFALALPVWLRDRRWLEMLAALALAGFCMGYVLQSRSGLVGLVVLVPLVLVYLGLQRPRWLLWGAAVGALLALLLAWATLQVPEVGQLFSRADSGRLELWAILGGEWMNCGVLLGCGLEHEAGRALSNGAPIQHPHNIYLALGVYTGLPALVLFVTLMLLTLQRAWVHRDAWGLYLFVALVVLNFDGSTLVGNPDELWLLVLLPAALILNRRADARAAG